MTTLIGDKDVESQDVETEYKKWVKSSASELWIREVMDELIQDEILAMETDWDEGSRREIE